MSPARGGAGVTSRGRGGRTRSRLHTTSSHYRDPPLAGSGTGVKLIAAHMQSTGMTEGRGGGVMRLLERSHPLVG